MGKVFWGLVVLVFVAAFGFGLAYWIGESARVSVLQWWMTLITVVVTAGLLIIFAVALLRAARKSESADSRPAQPPVIVIQGGQPQALPAPGQTLYDQWRVLPEAERAGIRVLGDDEE
jgi:hypothetical protein